MRKLILTSLLLLTGMSLAHASDGYEIVAGAAHELDNAANHFYQEMKYEAGYGHVTRDAERFAEAARHFHRQVERGSNYMHIRGDYAELAGAYVHVREEFGDRPGLRRDRHLRGDFREVERAYLNLNRAIEYARRSYSHYRGNDRHYRHDRRHEGAYPYGRGFGRRDSGLSITFRGVFGS